MDEIDLHGYTHEKAVSLVEETLIIGSLQRIMEYKIITGKSPKLQSKLIDLFKKYNFSYYIPSYNQGMILVSDNEL